jgi:hypothetical protein
MSTSIPTVTPSDALGVIAHGLENNINQLWVGPPGVGKTDILTQAGEQAGYKVRLTHPVTADQTDYKGFPCKIDVDGEPRAEFIPFGDLRYIIETREKVMLLIDDLITVTPAVQAALMQILLAREINGMPVSDTVRIVAATNRKEDRAGGSMILSPVKSRCTIMNLEPSQQDWALWASNRGISPVCIAFTNWRPEFLTTIKQTPEIANLHCPRTMTTMFRIWQSGGYPKRAEHAYLAGAAGAEVAAEFLSFVRIWQELPDIDKCLADPTTMPKTEKPDIKFAMAGALSARADKKNAKAFYKCAEQLGPDFCVVAIRDALRRDNSLIHVPEFTDWVIKNQDIVLV